jgi:hypothetical protein
MRGGNVFPKDTWFDLSRTPSLLKMENVAARVAEGACRVMTTLTPQLVNEIQNCLTKHAVEVLAHEMCVMLGVDYKF